MRAKIANWWDSVRSGLWFVPLLAGAAAVLFSFGALEVDRRYGDWIRKLGWISAGSSEDARETLSTVANSIATVAGVVFSVTVVVLTLASQQFGPRVIRQFMRDKWNQIALGIMVATFAYCLVVLRAIGPAAAVGIVPDFSVNVAVVFGLLSLAVMVLFIHHVASGVQAANVIAALSCEIEESAREHLPEASASTSEDSVDPFPANGCRPVAWDRTSSYLQAISYERLIALAVRHDVVLQIRRRPGHFIISGEAIAYVWPGEKLTNELARSICQSFEAGTQRTQSQDIEFGIDQIRQVALRALSPSLNDPATANICIDHLASALCYISRRRLPDIHFRDTNRRVRIYGCGVTFRHFVEAAFNDIRENSSSHLSVTLRLMEDLTRIARLARTDEQRLAIREQFELVRTAAEQRALSTKDRGDLSDRYWKALPVFEPDGTDEQSRNVA